MCKFKFQSKKFPELPHLSIAGYILIHQLAQGLAAIVSRVYLRFNQLWPESDG